MEKHGLMHLCLDPVLTPCCGADVLLVAVGKSTVAGSRGCTASCWRTVGPGLQQHCGTSAVSQNESSVPGDTSVDVQRGLVALCTSHGT